jgi:integrase
MKREAELPTGTYQSNDRKTWDEFRVEYDSKILDGMGVRNRDETCQALSQLFPEFHALQKAAGIKPEWGKDHYGFHDLRRAFATMNAERLTADALQLLMQHKDYQTTQRYISMARQLKPAAQNLFVPDVGLSQAT